METHELTPAEDLTLLPLYGDGAVIDSCYLYWNRWENRPAGLHPAQGAERKGHADGAHGDVQLLLPAG